MPSVFRSIQRVYFDDLDALNILHNMRYLLFMERARGELLIQRGFRWEDDITVNPDKFHVVAEHAIRYLSPVRGEGELAVELTVAHLGRSSLTFAGKVKSVDDTHLYADCTTRLVRLDPATNRPCPWTDRFRAAMALLAAWLSPAGRRCDRTCSTAPSRPAGTRARRTG